MYALLPSWCIVCKRNGKMMLNLDVPRRKEDDRRPSICIDCSKAIVKLCDSQGTYPTLFQEEMAKPGKAANTNGKT